MKRREPETQSDANQRFAEAKGTTLSRAAAQGGARLRATKGDRAQHIAKLRESGLVELLIESIFNAMDKPALFSLFFLASASFLQHANAANPSADQASLVDRPCTASRQEAESTDPFDDEGDYAKAAEW